MTKLKENLLDPENPSSNGRVKRMKASDHKQKEHSSDNQQSNSFLIEKLRWILPLLAMFAYLADSLWSSFAFMTSYAGLPSSSCLVFYYFCYDHRIPRNTYYFYAYFGCLTLCNFAGNIVYLLQALDLLQPPEDAPHPPHFNALSVMMMFWTITDFVFLVMVAFCSGHKQPLIPFTHRVIFLLIARTEILFAIFVPLMSNTQLEPTNIIALFLTFEVVTHDYDHLPNQICACIWIYSGFSIAASLAEWIHLGQSSFEKHDDDSHHHEEDAAYVISLVFEYLGSLVLYVLIILNLVMNRKTGDGNHEVHQPQHDNRSTGQTAFRNRQVSNPVLSEGIL